MSLKMTKSLPFRLLTIFVLQMSLIACIFIAVAHGPFMYQTWLMGNGRQLFWEVSLTRIFSSAVCDGPPEFHYLCLSTFKRTNGPISSVADAICALERGHPPADPRYQPDIQRIAESCGGLRRLESYSTITFTLLIIAAAFLSFSLISLLRWCYASFDIKKRRWYFVSLIFLVFDCIFLVVTAILYGVGLGSIGGLFYYSWPNDPNKSLIHPVDAGSLGWGYWLIVSVIVLHIFLGIAFAMFVPRGLKHPPRFTKSTKAKKRVIKGGRKSGREDVEEGESDDGTPKKVFWAYMPEVFSSGFGGSQYGSPYTHDEQVGLLPEHYAQTETTGYGTVTTTYVGEPTTVTTTYLPQSDGSYATYQT